MGITKDTKRKYISSLFKHQDGVVISNIINVLANNHLFDYLATHSKVTLQQLLHQFPFFHKGYLNVALRSLASQGILSYQVTPNQIEITTTPKFQKFQQYIPLYQQFSKLYTRQYTLLQTPLNEDLVLDDKIIEYSSSYQKIVNKHKKEDYFTNEVAVHLEAIILLPLLVSLNFRATVLDTQIENLLTDEIKTVFTNLGILKNGDFTQRGQFLMDKSYAYGVTTSYFPILSQVETYLKGNFNSFFSLDDNGKEKHVFRAINVWGSGGAHATYFKKFDQVIIDIFNKPLHQQPKGIIDVGCGDGTLLAHIFDLIWNKTARKDDLSKNKLILIGVDYNKEALLSTQRNLQKADVWAEVIWGDIGNPEELNTQLEKKFNVSLSDLLNVRSFLDHNRPFNEPKSKPATYHYSTGAFAHRGKHLKNEWVEQSLVEHLLKWKKYIQKHGLLMIELHTVSPNKVSLNLGKTPCTAYDVTHGFSDQYIVGINTFKRAVTTAGLQIDDTHNYVFPNKETPTISINLISG